MDKLKEAIAEAKLIKETAISEAKNKLEEMITPKLMANLSTKIQEMEEDEEINENDDVKEYGLEHDSTQVDDEDFDHPSLKKKKTANETEEIEETEEEMDLDELLAELEGEIKEENTENELDETNEKIDEAETETETEEEAETEETEEEEFNLEKMSESEMEEFIQDVVKEMVDAGELESESVSEAKKPKQLKFMKMKKPVKEINYNSKLVKENIQLKKALKEQTDTLSEVNLLNAKLLYSNKIFKAKNLSENQKIKILETFDKANSINGVKLIYTTLLETIKDKKQYVNESLRLGSSSKPVITTIKKDIVDNSTFNRLQELAGLKK